MTRLLITGGSSYLGQHLVPLGRQQLGARDALLYTYFSHDPLQGPGGGQLDLRDEKATRTLVDDFSPSVIIHTAGSNRPAATMESVIRRGAEHVTAAAIRHGARLIHLSTDVIFDGRHAPYREEDTPQPLHVYGRAKAAAETIVSRHQRTAIVRTSLIYGLHKMDRGTEWVVRALQAGEPVTLFGDQMRNPILVDSLCRACLELVSHAYTGILHIAGADRISRADFMLRLLAWWRITPGPGLVVGPSDPDRWPLDTTLDITRATALLRTPLPGVREILPSETPIS
ncbi:MAG: SDR family oxidoreductase [Anaerolineae bacterium]|nr:SDR family oxidoreductase [Anaerolineae bacterium]